MPYSAFRWKVALLLRRSFDVGFVLSYYPVVGTVFFHFGNRLVEIGDDSRMIGVFSAHADIYTRVVSGVARIFKVAILSGMV